MQFIFLGLVLSESLYVVLFHMFNIKNVSNPRRAHKHHIVKICLFYEGLLSCINAGPKSVTNVVLLPHKGKGPGLIMLIYKAN
jgi:hypothetical protein